MSDSDTRRDQTAARERRQHETATWAAAAVARAIDDAKSSRSAAQE